ncbi:MULTISPECIES: YCF48-related protein [unclassified Mesorhizobium]|uniref:WD40/YVTN/BNR-like repeat-containing protein n=1 Tax=unclassified Mesorhizobium TaxID=325217 RepID=UPI0018DB6AC3|nr:MULTISPECIES: YCF48-related protein [unclassified Mesorhizobium]WJI79406.1 YCF48-related protein [Mesorhizobium sp. C374B]WJI85941.1 YCF48-related protein [Mesorhizobium sp. C372A]
MKYGWRPTLAPVQTRYDDIWFISPSIGWAVNSAGQIVHTEDGGQTPWTIQHTVDPDTWLRCMSFSSPTDGWIGSITRRQRLWKTTDGKTWNDMTPKLPPQPSAICGISSPSKNVVFASGTQYPSREAAVMHTADGGETWNSVSMAAHANLLIDTHFTDDTHGWVVGGIGGTTYDRLKPVVLFTANGGKTWEDKLQDSGINFPRGEWGWKIQFLDDRVGFVSLENDTAAAILKTTDGGQTWKRIEITDPQRNVNLEGIGFLDEMTGWVGGWGSGFPSNPLGTTSGTADGGATWSDANDVGRFINRFRFTGSEPIVAYASGGTIYQCIATPDTEHARISVAARRAAETPLPLAWDSLVIEAQVPENAMRLTITIFDPRQTLVKILVDEKSPTPGSRTFKWDFKNEDGAETGIGHFMYRVSIDDAATTGMVARPGLASPAELGARVVEMIERYAPLARRSHDELVLPGADGTPATLKSLFNTPRDLMAALIRGGWVVPGAPDRSMFLVAIIGTGPMQGELAQVDVDLLSEWITAGAVIPGLESDQTASKL